MKKLSIILLVTILLITLVGCADDTGFFPANQQPIGSETAAVPIDNSENEEEETSDTAATAPLNQSEVSSTSSSDNSSDSSKVPVIPQETTSSSKPSQEITPETHNYQEPTNSESPPIVPFDPAPYVAEAIYHGENIGLIYDELYVSKGNWNPWVNLNNNLSEAQMMKNIRDSLKILVNEDREYFFISCEPQIDGSQHMYIYFG